MATIFSARAVKRDYSERISSHLAAALVLFAVLQIIIVSMNGGSLVLHLGIFVAIGGFALAARNLEHRWIALCVNRAPSQRLASRFREDVITLWVASLVGPFLWIPVATVGRLLFG